MSQGLRIAPPEAPVVSKTTRSSSFDVLSIVLQTGYMFGKGLYFADMSSKSANYCYVTPQKNTGLLLLSEVSCAFWRKSFLSSLDLGGTRQMERIISRGQYCQQAARRFSQCQSVGLRCAQSG